MYAIRSYYETHLERKAAVGRHALAVEEKRDVAHLHIVHDAGHQRQERSSLDGWLFPPGKHVQVV